MRHPLLVQRLRRVVGTENVFADRADLLSYEYDAGFESHSPDIVVLPDGTAQVQAVIRLANEAGMPVVARGAGTGLCSGAVPLKGGIVISFARMNRILEIDYRNRIAIVEPGVINLELSERTVP